MMAAESPTRAWMYAICALQRHAPIAAHHTACLMLTLHRYLVPCAPVSACDVEVGCECAGRREMWLMAVHMLESWGRFWHLHAIELMHTSDQAP